MTQNELVEIARNMGMTAFTGRQIADWLYHRHVSSSDEMTNLSKVNRAKLAELYTIGGSMLLLTGSAYIT